MDKIEKFLRKLSLKEREVVEQAIGSVLRGDVDGLDVKKLRGYADIFRVRKGRLRIIYRQSGSKITLLSIGKRNEGTYQDF